MCVNFITVDIEFSQVANARGDVVFAGESSCLFVCCCIARMASIVACFVITFDC
jgi:hypothetical protein